MKVFYFKYVLAKRITWSKVLDKLNEWGGTGGLD